MEGGEFYPGNSAELLDMQLRAQVVADGALLELSRKKTIDQVLEIPGIRDGLEELLEFGARQANSQVTYEDSTYQNLEEHQKVALLSTFLSKLIIDRHDRLTDAKQTERLWLIITVDSNGQPVEEWRSGRTPLDVLAPGDSVYVGYEGLYWADVYDSLEK